MSRTVYLVRHAAHGDLGQRLTGRRDAGPLSAEGQAQARAVAQALARRGVGEVVASPRRRTQETAAEICRACGNLTLRTEPALDEIEFGAWSGQAFEALDSDPAWRRWNADRGRSRPPGGETMLEAQARAAIWFEGLDRTRAQPLAAVSHADLIKALVAHLIGLPIHFFDRFEISPASMTTLTLWPGGGVRLEGLNEAPHE